MPERPLLTWVNGSVRTTARLTETTLPACMSHAARRHPPAPHAGSAGPQPVEQPGRDDRDRERPGGDELLVALDVRDLPVQTLVVELEPVSAPGSVGSTIQYDGTPIFS